MKDIDKIKLEVAKLVNFLECVSANVAQDGSVTIQSGSALDHYLVEAVESSLILEALVKG